MMPAGLALLAVILLLFRRRRPRAPEGPLAAPSLRAAEKRLQQACAAGDAKAVEDAMLAIGIARWPQAPPPGPAAVARRLGDADLLAAIEALEARRFGPSAESGGAADLQGIWQAYRARGRGHSAARMTSPLPPLYPQQG